MDLVVEVFLALTRKVLVFLLSLGAWRSESIMGKESSIYAASGALSFVRDDRRVITVTGQQLLGMVFYGLLVVPVLLMASLR